MKHFCANILNISWCIVIMSWDAHHTESPLDRVEALLFGSGFVCLSLSLLRCTYWRNTFHSGHFATMPQSIPSNRLLDQPDTETLASWIPSPHNNIYIYIYFVLQSHTRKHYPGSSSIQIEVCTVSLFHSQLPLRKTPWERYFCARRSCEDLEKSSFTLLMLLVVIDVC